MKILIQLSAMLTNIIYSMSAKAADDEGYSTDWMQAGMWRKSRLPKYEQV